MTDARAAGLLLHPTSLPGPHGIGDLGPTVPRWLDYLSASGSSVWQVLPLGPTGYGDSPYQCFSAFAGNPLLVSPALLHRDGLLADAEVAGTPDFGSGPVDFGAVIPWKLALLDRAHHRYSTGHAGHLEEEFRNFCAGHRAWLDDFALFMALKEAHGGGIWLDWPAELVLREPGALRDAAARFSDEVERHSFRQFLFFRQWDEVRIEAAKREIRIVGDAPIFVAIDSADVWANPELFMLTPERTPRVVAGVPPDYFSPTGQLWGNPLYDWDVHAESGYAWWIARMRAVLDLVDIVRIDHFRGFVDYWEVPAGAATAIRGRWVDGPGADLFSALAEALGELPIIAEALGEIHAGVPKLRDRLGLPGMKVLQFAFDGDPENEFLPHLYPENSAAYTGTHDNDTTVGWFAAAGRKERKQALSYLESDGGDIAWDFIAAVWESNANLAVAPMQDVLRLDSSARMNRPGVAAGNWSWRMHDAALEGGHAAELAQLAARSRRTAARQGRN